jgi:hypothetical protein
MLIICFSCSAFFTFNKQTILLADMLNNKMCLRDATVFYNQQYIKINKKYKITTDKIK